MGYKTLFFIILGFCVILISIIALIFSILIRKDICMNIKDAGTCRMNDQKSHCYCIDFVKLETTETEMDIAHHAKSKCESLGGSLAPVISSDLLLWLAKRLYTTNIDNAFVGLEKRNRRWVWVMEDGVKRTAANLIWRSDFPYHSNHSHAVISVETRISHDNDYKSYNYDYYSENDHEYQWFGFRTSEINLEQAHIICRYSVQSIKTSNFSNEIAEPSNSSQVQISELCSSSCSNNDEIFLPTIGQNRIITSPEYPRIYCNNLQCGWTIITSKPNVVKLEWLAIETENARDIIQIFDGKSASGKLLASCSGSFCSNHVSNRAAMRIEFKSDHITAVGGFKALVTVIHEDHCLCNKEATGISLYLNESYSFTSPNFPNPYCKDNDCSWRAVGPLGFGLRISWSYFTTQKDVDIVSIYEGDFLAKWCMGNSCSDYITNHNEVYITFSSDNEDSGHVGFRGHITVHPNYCDKKDLIAPVGSSVTYSQERDDGFIPPKSTATLKCSDNHTIINTMLTADNATCSSGRWDKPIGPCVLECHIIFQRSDEFQHRLPICAVGIKTIPSGETIMVEYINMKNERKRSEESFKCVGSVWSPHALACPLVEEGILMFGGLQNKPNPLISIYPLKLSRYTSQPSQRVQSRSTNGMMFSHHLPAVLLPDGHVLIIDERRIETTILVVHTGHALQGPTLNTFRTEGAAVAIVDGTVYICGGTVVTSRCEMLINGKWILTKPAHVQHYFVALAAYNHSIFVIGGEYDNDKKNHLVEKYVPEHQTWEFVAPLLDLGQYKKSPPTAAELNDFIFTCFGGVDDKGRTSSACQRYNPVKDLWERVADMNVGRVDFALVAFQGRLFAMGGRHRSTGASMDVIDSVESYNPKTNQWEMVQNLPIPTFSLTALVVPFIL